MLSAASLIAILAGSCAGALVSGVSGFAFGLVALSFWVWQLDPGFLAPMVVFGSIVTQSSSLAASRQPMDRSRLLPFLVGGIMGVPIGVLLLDVMDILMFKTMVGVLLVAYSSYLLLVRPGPPIRFGGRLADGAAGFVGGIMGGMAGLNGPAPVIWCTLRGWNKDAQRGVLQIFLLSTQVIALAGYAVTGKLTGPVLKVLALMLPAVIICGWIGARVCERISERLFKQLVLVLLLFSGVALLAGALTQS
jgi:hypothetical protein